ncbi:glycosyltransferase [Winogradskyella sp. UBA3174]|uniref:glycosyltransferase n=1 Tax=Winogradskyella sp. UBA3174 TaxID=1947785 RepID=UPI0025EA92BD|nr:glycosyltransferase [Winogradskyella sp. UBA3174]|tara:strand:- start:69740 stop:70231 length:492 start_codon:yes stop_codon:yes gene_type:complete
MKIGIIIIFNNNEAQFEKCFFIEQINAFKTIELCLVDNNSKDKTLQLLKDVKEACSSQVSIVEIKKHSSEDAAKRAGARYLFSQFNLRHIGFINVNASHIKGEHLNTLIEDVCKNQEFIINFNIETIKGQEVKQTLFKNIFSVVDYLKSIKTHTNFNNLNPSV